MAGIKADSKQFWQRFLESLKAGMPLREDGKDYSNKEIEVWYGVSPAAVNSLFGQKGRNYQSKWSDQEMGAFNSGEPAWDTHEILLASTMWGSKAASRCKAFSVKREEFESVVMASFDPTLSSLDNWQRGCAAADSLAASRFSGDFANDVKQSVEKYAAHFIGKLTNSNATTGAVLALPEASPQPYLYAGSIGDLSLDCAIGSSPDSAGYRKMLDCSRHVREHGRDAASDEDLAIADAFDDAIACLGSGEDRAINRTVDWLLRQVILPRNGGYVAMTPLAAAGICEKILAQRDDLPGQEIALPIGGTKPGNVTSIYSATRALVRDVPSVSHGGISVYLRLLHRGYSIAVGKPLLEALDHYGVWLARNEFVYRRNSVEAAELEIRSSGITRIVSLVLEDVQKVSNEVLDHLDSLELDERTAQLNALYDKGAIEAAIATGRFSHDFVEAITRRIVQRIDGHKFALGGAPSAKPRGKRSNEVSIMLGQKGRERLPRVIGELAPKFIARGI